MHSKRRVAMAAARARRMVRPLDGLQIVQRTAPPVVDVMARTAEYISALEGDRLVGCPHGWSSQSRTVPEQRRQQQWQQLQRRA